MFTAEVGVSPGRYVDRVRLETARRILETDHDRDLDAIARSAGFGNQQGMRRAFSLALGITPAEYRRRFGSPTGLHLAV
ncbi:MAG: helix-turn-helix domain-containing protein [Sporichthyaceae bacterium]